MRYLPLLLTSILLAVVALATAISGCEEALEVCPSCGSILSGDMINTAEPRLDGTFDAVRQIRRKAIEIANRFDATVSRLATALDVTPPEDGDVGQLAEAIKTLLNEGEDSVEQYIRFPDCFVDWDLAVSAQRSCEKKLCNNKTESETGLCVGYLEGTCNTADAEGCFEAFDGECDGNCIGTCMNMTEGKCPGYCLGTCDDMCSAYDEDDNCSGFCTGSCTGLCEAETPFECKGGTCIGACSTGDEADEADGGDEVTECTSVYGTCQSEEAVGKCSGHLYAKGGGSQQSCGDTADDCRETAKYLAWSGLTCTGADVEFFGFQINDTQTSAGRIGKLKLVERAYRDILTDYAWLSLIVNGIHLKQEGLPSQLKSNIENSNLDDLMFSYLSTGDALSPAVPDRAALPLESLKARVFWLKQRALNSENGYRIVAGAYDCLETNLDDALELLNRIIPTETSESDSKTTMTVDSTCSTVEEMKSESPLPPCLYSLLTRQHDLMELILPED